MFKEFCNVPIHANLLSTYCNLKRSEDCNPFGSWWGWGAEEEILQSRFAVAKKIRTKRCYSPNFMASLSWLWCCGVFYASHCYCGLVVAVVGRVVLDVIFWWFLIIVLIKFLLLSM